MAALARATRGLRLARHVTVNPLRRGFADAPAAAKEVAPAAAAPAAAAPVAPAALARKATRSVFRERLGAFVAGAAVGVYAGLYVLRNDLWRSTVQVEEAVAGLRGELVDTNAELRRRIAALEHKAASD